MLLECYSYNDMKIIGNTLDDSFGECYDKAAKMLGFGYPGGTVIDLLAQQAQRDGIKSILFPVPLSNQDTLNFSFSGLKNAFRLQLETKLELTNLINSIQSKNKYSKDEIKNHNDAKALALGLQDSATTHLIQKCKKYMKQNNHIKHFAIVGGASANSMLRIKASDLCEKFNKTLLVSKLQYCSDNAAMIGRAALAKILHDDIKREEILYYNPLSLEISPRNTEIR